MIRRLVLYAPNGHIGGGLVLLRALLTTWPLSGIELIAFLDTRARDELPLPDGCSVYWVAATAASRLKAEFDLRRQACDGGSVLLCFHGLPPMLPNKAKIIVFQQNRNHLGLNALSVFSWRTGLRLFIERLIGRCFRRRVMTYIVQTATMKRELIAWYQRGGSFQPMPNVKVLPFMDYLTSTPEQSSSGPCYDFLYVADGEAHKNHRTLLDAWSLLAKEGLRPTLALTLSPKDECLKAEVASVIREHNLAIVDLGNMPHRQALALYKSTRALIFPSTSESFGLPLIEASRMGVSILAGELDYVRDVCIPCETFNPNSSVSIARAVKRFLGEIEVPIAPLSPAVFWKELLILSE